MKPMFVVLLIVVVLVIAGGVSQAMKKKPPVEAPARAASDCVLPEDLHPSMIPSMAGSRSEEVRAELASMVGCMVPESGWSGQITSVSGQSVKFESGTGLGAFTIVLLMKEPHELQPGTTVRYRGRRDGATAKIVMGNVLNRVDLSEGELVQ